MGIALRQDTDSSHTAGMTAAVKAAQPTRRAPGFVVCPDAVVSTYSGKPILWAAINPGPFFFTWPSEKQWFLLDYCGVQYIAVPRSRIDDDTAAKHTGGYPRNFVEAPPADAVRRSLPGHRRPVDDRLPR